MPDLVHVTLNEIEDGNVDLAELNTLLRAYGMSQATGGTPEEFARRMRSFISNNSSGDRHLAIAVVAVAKRAPNHPELAEAWGLRHQNEQFFDPVAVVNAQGQRVPGDRVGSRADRSQIRTPLMGGEIPEVDDPNRETETVIDADGNEVTQNVSQLYDTLTGEPLRVGPRLDGDGVPIIEESGDPSLGTGEFTGEDPSLTISAPPGSINEADLEDEINRNNIDSLDRLLHPPWEGIDDIPVTVVDDEGNVREQIVSGGDQLMARNLYSAFGLDDLSRSSLNPNRSLSGLGGPQQRDSETQRFIDRLQPRETSATNSRRMLDRMSPTQLEQIQRTMWQAGYYGGEAIVNGAVPFFGFLDQATREAWTRLNEDVFRRPEFNGDFETALDVGIRRAATLHEETMRRNLDMQAERDAPRPSVQMTLADFDTDSAVSAVRTQLQSLIGRTVDQETIDQLVATARAQEESSQQTRFGIAQRQADAQFDEQQTNRNRFDPLAPAYDSRGFPIGSMTPHNSYVGPRASQGQGLAPIPTSGLVRGEGIDPAAGLTEENLEAALRGIRWNESGSPTGDYAARNGQSSAGGAYQFIDSTWLAAGGGNYGGGGIGNGLASYAPRDEQDRVARQQIIQMYQRYSQQYGAEEGWRKTFMAWFLPAWVGVREHETVPNHSDSLDSYANRLWSRAFGTQGQQARDAFRNRPVDRIQEDLDGTSGRGMPMGQTPASSSQFFDPDQPAALPQDMLSQYEQFDLNDSLSEEIRRRFPAETFANSMGEQMAQISQMVRGA